MNGNRQVPYQEVVIMSLFKKFPRAFLGPRAVSGIPSVERPEVSQNLVVVLPFCSRTINSKVLHLRER